MDILTYEGEETETSRRMANEEITFSYRNIRVRWWFIYTPTYVCAKMFSADWIPYNTNLKISSLISFGFPSLGFLIKK